MDTETPPLNGCHLLLTFYKIKVSQNQITRYSDDMAPNFSMDRTGDGFEKHFVQLYSM